MKYSFFVPGIPVPKGSTRAFYVPKLNRCVTMQTNAAKQKPWASMISVMAQEAGCRAVSGPISMHMEFIFPRPKSHYGSGKNASTVKASAPGYHTSKPDLDKLVRCVFDALTGVAWNDDSQCCHYNADKCYGDNPGCIIWLEAL